MSREYDDFENPEEWLDEVEEIEEISEVLRENEPEIPDVPREEDVENIEDPILQEKEIEVPKWIKDQERKLIEKAESGEIDQIEFEAEYFHKLGPKKNSAITQSGLDSVDLTWDKLADLSEDNEFLQRGDLETLEQKDRNKELIREVGVEKSREIADRLLEEEKIDEKGYDSISRLIRNQK